jgi:hypothetical protein
MPFAIAAFFIWADKNGGPRSQILGGILAALSGLCLLAFVGLAAAPFIRAALFNPNATDQGERIRLGQSLARRREEVAHLFQEVDDSRGGEAQWPILIDEEHKPKPHSSERTGTALKEVRCEECGLEYVYLLKRSVAIPVGGSNSEADARAGARLAALLREGVDLAPCPSCGRYQAEMVEREKNRVSYQLNQAALGLSYGWIVVVFLVLMSLVGVLQGHENAVIVTVGAAGLASFGCLLGCLALLAVARRRSERCDPNGLPREERIRIGQSLARPKQETPQES